MSNFNSYYWKSAKLETNILAEALKKLVSPDSTSEQKLASFRVLLESDSTIAQGIAFDQFFYNESLTRLGSNNLYARDAELLVEKARAQLRKPPVKVTVDNQEIVGANHASALGVLARLGNENDISQIAFVLKSSSDVNVLGMGLRASRTCLRDSNDVHVEIIEVLKQIIFNISLHLSIRKDAIYALAEYRVPEAEAILVESIENFPLPLSAAAAWILGARDREKYLPLLHQLSNSWPPDAPYPASEVRELLSTDLEEDED